MRVVKPQHSASIWIGCALALMIILQLSPFPGIYFMFFGGAILTGQLVHLFLAALFVESTMGRIPRALVAIPLLAYGGYYAAYFQEGRAIQAAAVAAQDARSDVALRFDPSEQSLVMKNARSFVADYDVPVAYEIDANVKPEGYLSYRLLPADQCAFVRASRAMPGMTRLLPRRPKGGDDGASCLLATPERPPHTVVTITKRGTDEIGARKPGIVATGVDVALAGEPIATHATGAYAWRLPGFPTLYVGCLLIDNPAAWQCTAEFARTLTKVGRVGELNDDTLAFALGAEMLGVGKVPTAGNHVAPRPVTDLDALLAKLPKLPQQQPTEGSQSDRDALNAFAGFLASDDYSTVKSGSWTMLVVDGADQPPRELTAAVARNPGWPGPVRDQMIAKLQAMREHGVSDVSQWVRLVVNALASMPKEDMVAMSDASLDSLLQYLRDTEAWRYGGLYERTADVGERALRFYSDDVVRYAQVWPEGKNPALAICQIGEADDAARQALRAAYLKFLPGDSKRTSFNVVQYGSALFLALLASGDDQFLRDNPVGGADQMGREWYGLLLDGKGRVDGKPNNCQVVDRSRGRPQGLTSSGLVWSDGHWVETAAAGR
jgi:hypothetical protein